MVRKPNDPDISYQMVDGVPEEEIQRRLDKAFDILFDEVDRKLSQQPRSMLDPLRIVPNTPLTEIDNKE